MTYPKVSIIILNFNQKLFTLACLTSLKKITYPNYEVILVDNNSNDGSAEAIAKKFPEITLVRSKENLGYAGGNNLGFKKTSAEYVLILNNDTKVTLGFLEPLVRDMLNDSSLGIVQSKIFTMDNPELLDGVVSYQTATGFLYHKGYLDVDKTEYAKLLYTFSAKGACILIRREALKLGLFDPDYFAYFEETDLCWRTWILGYKVAFEPGSIIYHKMGATSSTMRSAFINYHSFKNRIRTIIKNTGPYTLLWMLPIHITTCLGLVVFFLFSDQYNGSLSILRAIWWNIRMANETWKQRKKVQSERKISDNEIFNQVMKNPPLSFYSHHLSLIKGNLTK
ncbi:MAG: glycosyltransferase family 2 protein [Patescibacteria group bacterium]